MIGRKFVETDLEAKKLQTTLRNIGILGIGGAGLVAMGEVGLRAFRGLTDAAREYAHQVNIMNMAGLSQVEIAQGVSAAWKNTGDVITSSATNNLKMLLDLRNVLGSMEFAQRELPVVSRIQAVLASSSESSIRKTASDNFAFTMAKALDVIGAAKDPATFQAQAEQMSKVITAFQGRVTPTMFQSVFAYARQAKYGLDTEFLYQILPTLMLEYAQGGAHSSGGGSRGVGPGIAAFSRLVLQGYVNRKAVPELEELGLLSPGAEERMKGGKRGGRTTEVFETSAGGRTVLHERALKTTTPGTTIEPMKGHELAARNPFQWVQEFLLPAIEKKYKGEATPEQIRQEIIGITRGNQLAGQVMLEFALKQQNFLRDQAIIRGAMEPGQAYNQALRHDPEFAFTAVSTQWENLKTAFGMAVIPQLIPMMIRLTGALNSMAQWAERHPNLAATLIDVGAGLTAMALAGGTLLLFTAGIKALGLVLPGLALVSGPIGWVVLGITAAVAGAAAIYANWDRVGPRLNLALHNLSDWIGQTGDIIVRDLGNMFRMVRRWLATIGINIGDDVPAKPPKPLGTGSAPVIDLTKPWFRLRDGPSPGIDQNFNPDGYMQNADGRQSLISPRPTLVDKNITGAASDDWVVRRLGLSRTYAEQGEAEKSYDQIKDLPARRGLGHSIGSDDPPQKDPLSMMMRRSGRGSPFVPTAGGNEVTINVPINLDGREIANITAKHMIKDWNNPATGTGSFDPYQSFMPTAAPATALY